MGAAFRAPEGASADGHSILNRIPVWLADDLARFGFGGRLAIWGIVLPLAGLVIAWSAILAMGDEDAAVAFGARWVSAYACWLSGIMAAIIGRRIVSHSLLARGRRARREAFHRLLTEEYGRRPARSDHEAPPPLTLLEMIVAISVALMILALAAPAAGMPAQEDFLLFGSPAVAMGVAGLLVAVALKRRSDRNEACRKRFGEWKARREGRRAAKADAETEGVR